MLRTNASNLVMLSVQGQITPPMQHGRDAARCYRASL
jgi:hypothetical protein